MRLRKLSIALVGVGLASCGARSGLLDLVTTTSGSGGSSGSSGAGGGGGSSTIDASSDTAVGGAPADAGPDATTPLCVLTEVGVKEIVAFPDRHATAPSILTLDAGSSGAPASAALQVFASGGSSLLHDDIQVARLRIGSAFPDDTLIDQGPSLVGIESHGWALLAPGIGSAAHVALGWHGDPNANSRVLLRFLDTNSWVSSDPVTVDDDGEAVLDLARGAGIGHLGVGYDGDGYGIVFRSVDYEDPKTPTQSKAAVLDPSGAVVFAARAVAPASAYPGYSSSLLWTGTTYLVATGMGDCDPSEPLCAPSSVGISKLVPATGDFVDDSHIELVSAIPTHLPNAPVRRPTLAAHGGRVFVAWRESGAKDPPEFDVVRVAELDASGNVVSTPVDVASVLAIETRVTLTASELGLVLSYGEDGDEKSPDGTPGRSRVVVHHLGFDLAPLSPPIAIASTRIQTYGPPHTAALSDPRSVLVTWSARSQSNGLDVTYLARLDCNASSAAEYAGEVGPPTALERFFISKYDPARALCFRVHLAAPGQFGPYSIVTPEPWTVEKITVSQNAPSCEGFDDSNAELAQSATGTLSWPTSSTLLPCSVDANLALVFSTVTEPFTAKDVSIKGAWGCDGG